jgi:microcystin degradation protein MlrC
LNRFYIGIAGFGHETVTFWPELTPLEEFERIALHGEQIIEVRKQTNSVLGGFMSVCERHHIGILPVCDVEVEASGIVSDEAFEFYSARMCETFGRAVDQKNLDGILLYLHGAMVTESHPCAEYDLLAALRTAVGITIPIMVAFDLHGNLHPALCDLIQGGFAYRSSPHTDMFETGERTARVMVATLEGKVNPVWAMTKPGLAVPSVFSATTVSPAKDIIEETLRMQDYPGVLDASFLFGFAWSDVAHLGASAVTVTDGKQEQAQQGCDRLADFAWSRREELTGRRGNVLYSVETGVRRAIEHAQTASKPILLLDHADRTYDTTFVLEELLHKTERTADKTVKTGTEEGDKTVRSSRMATTKCRIAVPLFYDPAAVQHCMQAVQSAREEEVELAVGGRTGWRDNGPVTIKGKVAWIGEGAYVGTGPMTNKKWMDLGPTAIVDNGSIWLQLVSHNAVLMDEDPFIQFGRRPEEFDIIVSKSKTHFRTVYERIAEEIIIIDAPGQCPADLCVFLYQNVPSGVYPVT